MNIQEPGDLLSHKPNRRRKLLFGGIFIAGLLFVLILSLWLGRRATEPGEAPEAESVLNAQVEMPFQVLIPAYLPKVFVREKTQVNIEGVGPQGEPMIELIYQTRNGEKLTFIEWLPSTEQDTGGRKAAYCMCMCQTPEECDSVEMGMTIGSLRVMAKVTAPDIMTAEEARAVLDTMGPAVNRQVYSSLKEVPVSYMAPPAVEIPVNADGIQEVTLVVTPNGYNPEHFSVRKGVPVVLTFRQLGQVGCGNALIFQWGKGKSTTISLASQSDSQTIEFTPGESGVFKFNCPHYIYRGVMSVLD